MKKVSTGAVLRILGKYNDMKKHLSFKLTVLLFTLMIKAHCQDLTLDWSGAIVGTDIVSVSEAVMDEQGNIYLTGYFAGTADFDPGTGVAELTSFNSGEGSDTFIAKYDSNGEYIFSLASNDYGSSSVNKMLIDPEGNLILIGTFFSTCDFDLGASETILTSEDFDDPFIACYTSEGTFIEVVRAGGGAEVAHIDIDGNLFIAGGFSDTLDIDPGPDTFNLTSEAEESSFVIKYNSDLEPLWGFVLESSITLDIQDLIIDQQDNIYISGVFWGNLDADPSPGSALFSAENLDGFIAKYDGAGNYLFASSYNGSVRKMVVDSEENLYAIGSFLNSMDVDPGPDEQLIISGSEISLFLSKYDSDGNYLAAKAFPENSIVQSAGFEIDQNDDVYIIGRMRDTVDFNPGNPGGELISGGNYDAFLAKFNSQLQYVYAYNWGDNTVDESRKLLIDNSGGLFLTGQFNGAVDADPGEGEALLESLDASGTFLFQFQDDTYVSIAKGNGLNAFPIMISSYEKSVMIVFALLLEDVEADITVYTLSGQRLFSDNHHSKGKVQIDLPFLNPGIYLVEVRNKGSRVIKKVWIGY